MLYLKKMEGKNRLNCETYKTCSHWCKYCFSMIHWNTYWIAKEIKRTSKLVPKFFEEFENHNIFEEIKFLGKKWRFKDYYWKIIYWGNAVDPFSDFEKKYKVSKILLSSFKKQDYPLVISTKSNWLANDDSYLNLFYKNITLKISIPIIDENKASIIEQWTTVKNRIELIKKLKGKVKEIIVRIQPFIIWLSDVDLAKTIEFYKSIWVDSIFFDLLHIPACIGENSKQYLDWLSAIIGYDVVDYYKKNGYYKNWKYKLNYKTRFKIIEKLKKETDKNWLNIYVCNKKEREQFLLPSFY